MEKIILSKDAYLNFSLGEFGRRAKSPYFNASDGEHYKLLAFLSNLMPEGSLLTDLGTYQGYSAYALSFNPKVKVISYGTEGAVAPEIRSLMNVTYVEDDYANHWDEILASNLIMVDLNHTGTEERKIYDTLRSANWKGVLVFDDIKLSPEMTAFFDSIETPKFDVTAYGHFSGTGIAPLNIEMEVFGQTAPVEKSEGAIPVEEPVKPNDIIPVEERIKSDETTPEAPVKPSKSAKAAKEEKTE